MTEELEQKAEEYLVNFFCKKADEEYMIKECNTGERIRCIAFEERKEMLIEFAKEATKELQEQVGKMKCCGNCIGQMRSSFQRIHCSRCKNKSDWRLAE